MKKNQNAKAETKAETKAEKMLLDLLKQIKLIIQGRKALGLISRLFGKKKENETPLLSSSNSTNIPTPTPMIATTTSGNFTGLLSGSQIQLNTTYEQLYTNLENKFKSIPLDKDFEKKLYGLIQTFIKECKTQNPPYNYQPILGKLLNNQLVFDQQYIRFLSLNYLPIVKNTLLNLQV